MTLFHQLARSARFGATAVLLASAPAPVSSESFVNLRFYPDEAIAEERPSKPYPITLSFTGRVFAPPLWFSEISENPSSVTADERFLTRVVRVNGGGSPEEILALWNPEERAAVSADLADTEVFSQSQSFYRSIGDSAFLAKVRYGPYILYVIRHRNPAAEDFIHIYPLAESGNGLFLTNRLKDDPMLQFLFLVYRERLAPRQAEARSGNAPSRDASVGTQADQGPRSLGRRD